MGIAIKNNSHFTISKIKAMNETTTNNNERRILNVESQSVTRVYMYFIVLVVNIFKMSQVLTITFRTSCTHSLLKIFYKCLPGFFSQRDSTMLRLIGQGWGQLRPIYMIISQKCLNSLNLTRFSIYATT